MFSEIVNVYFFLQHLNMLLKPWLNIIVYSATYSLFLALQQFNNKKKSSPAIISCPLILVILVCLVLSSGPPIILISPEDTTLNMSQDAVLQCQADAYPSNLTYEWLKQGQNVYHIE